MHEDGIEMKKKHVLMDFVLIIATLIVAVCFFETSELTLKGLASAGFVLTGIVNWRYCKVKKAVTHGFPGITVIGLFFSMCADVVLNLHFISGVFLFASAHVIYLLAYCRLMKLKKYDFVPIGLIALATVLFILVAPIWAFDTPMLKYVCIIYAIIISSMLGKAVSNLFRKPNITSMVLAIGSGLFYFSDLMLALNMFSEVTIFESIISLMTYYVAQCMIAGSILCYGNSKELTKEKRNHEYCIEKE